MLDPILNVPVSLARAYTGRRLVVRIDSREDWSSLDGIEPEQIAWIEVSLDVACAVRPTQFRVDIILSDPAREAGRLYQIAEWSDPLRPPRITIPAITGADTAGAVAIALGLPVRILARQPGHENVVALDHLLDRYLHDPGASQPVEFFHSLLESFLYSSPKDLWEALEEDPSLFPRIAGPEDGMNSSRPPQVRGFVSDHVAMLTVERRDCVYCAFQSCCAGYFKWPDRSYDCSHVQGLLGRIAEIAARLRADLSEMAVLEE